MTERDHFQGMIAGAARLLGDDHAVWGNLAQELRVSVNEHVDNLLGTRCSVVAAPAKRASTGADDAAADKANADSILGAMSTDDPVSVGTIASWVALDVARVSKLLVKLVRAGKVVKTGARRGSRYALAPDAPEQATIPGSEP